MGPNFRKILREELDYQGLTVKELALKAAVAKGAIDSYLGKQASMPPADTAVRIAEALGVTVEYLVKGQDCGRDTPRQTHERNHCVKMTKTTQKHEIS